MSTHVVFALNLALFMVTLLWVGNKPTAAKTVLLMAAVCALHMGCDIWTIHGQGMSMSQWYAQTLGERVRLAAGSVDAAQGEQLTALAGQLSVLWPTLYAFQAWLLVLICLGLRWVCNRTFAQSGEWKALSQIDLSVWWVLPLVAGVVLYIVALVPGVQVAHELRIASANVLFISTLPLVVQGAASSKGVMNRRNLSPGLQLSIAVAGLFSGVAALVLPVWGLLDFWVNFRKLPREAEEGLVHVPR